MTPPIETAQALHTAIELGRVGQELQDLFTADATVTEYPNLIKPAGAPPDLSQPLAASPARGGPAAEGPHRPVPHCPRRTDLRDRHLRLLRAVLSSTVRYKVRCTAPVCS